MTLTGRPIKVRNGIHKEKDMTILLKLSENLYLVTDQDEDRVLRKVYLLNSDAMSKEERG